MDAMLDPFGKGCRDCLPLPPTGQPKRFSLNNLIFLCTTNFSNGLGKKKLQSFDNLLILLPVLPLCHAANMAPAQISPVII